MVTIQSHLLGAVGRLISRLAYKNYYSAKAYYHFHLHLSKLGKKDPLLVYQMGKVGSTTILMSLKALALDTPIYHVHFLTQYIIDRVEKGERKKFSYKDVGRCIHLWTSQYIRKQIDMGLKGKKWKIVTVTRDPIGRNISAFFQSLKFELSDSGHQYKIKSDYGFEITMNLEDIENLIDFFFEKFDHDAPIVFFDREFKGVFGIDVFSSEFPKVKGYKIYEEEHADVLLIKLENLNECAHDAFKEFLNIDGFNLIRANIASEKAYYPIYRKFLDSIVIPDSYIDQMYTSKYAQHFYSEKEINKFKAKWCKENVV